MKNKKLLAWSGSRSFKTVRRYAIPRLRDPLLLLVLLLVLLLRVV